MDVWKLEKGTVIKLLGFPYELAEDTVVLGNTPPESVKKVWKLNK